MKKGNSKLWDAVESDMDRKSIYVEGFPLTVPYSQLSEETTLNLINSVLENDEQVMITLFRESVEQKLENKLLRQIKGKMNKITLQFVVDVNSKFPDYNVSLLPWPEVIRTVHDTKRSTHPFISSRCRAAVRISKSDVKELDKFSEMLFRAVHDEMMLKSQKRWVILGDETGDLSEFRSGNQENARSTMCWIAIPPGTELPALHPEFHAAGSQGNKEYFEAITNINNAKKIMMFTFAFEQGNVLPNLNKIGRDPHLSFWKETLPLVLETISRKIHDKTKVDVFIEQVAGLESGIGVIQPIVSSLVTKFKDRPGWKNMFFDQLWVVSKGEHPWIGYPDAIGQCINKNKHKYSDDFMKNHMEIDENIYSRIRKHPFRQESLNGPISFTHNSISQPLVFLKSLSSIESQDVEDYVKPFFYEAIKEARNSLNSGEWQDLLKHFKNTAENIEGQHATNLILSDIDIDSTLSKFHNNYHKYEFLKSVLGTSNHIGQTDTANQCKVYIDGLIDEGLKLSKSEILKLNNLSGGANDNQFDFSHIIDNFELDEDDVIDWNEETRTYLGAQALSRALRNSRDDLEIAWEIEEKLLSIDQQTDEQFRRRYILRSELLLQRGEFFEAQRALEIDFPARINKPDNQLHISDKYYLATLLKCYALNGHTEGFKEVCELIELNDHHPSQRIAYWFCRWAQEIAQTDNELFRTCINHLLSLKEIPFFQKEAPGVILACELIDLHNRGFIVEDQNSILDFVLTNSQGYANEWVKQHPPNAEDWLAPLNFNYR